MALGTMMIACPSCSCHAFARESNCPGCGAVLRAPDGSIQRTAGAAFLGLTLAFAVACSSETSGSTSTSSGAGGASSTTSGMGGFQTMSTYGVASSGGFGGSGSSSSTSGSSGSSTGAGGAGGSGK